MEIYDHDSPEAITYKNNSIELENWLEHFQYIHKEISSLLDIGKTERANSSEFGPILLNLQNKQEENSATIDDFNNYKNNLPKAAECEDVSCDMFYVNEHERYRKSYRAHLESYREIKEEYFRILSK
ncbi:hypothetical protein EI546_09885 [Aequorivita sp. H23M31]|uniref:Uncharacterized protein n=1 Tax=Aequorivita ciconiae TaxID=2494375 RepID=A0A410G431_9FLAO|nr:hypothetical protein [Aequorivita sp. H23M31]QAA82013.1 hypothetical protein EI546_09885 [Aequorivita sp. H23M31]